MGDPPLSLEGSHLSLQLVLKISDTSKLHGDDGTSEIKFVNL